MSNLFNNPDNLVDVVRQILSGKPLEEKKKEEELDPVNKQAVKKKFDDRKDKDIDNDGDVDSSDKFLHKRRKAISKAINEKDPKKKINASHCEEVEIDLDEENLEENAAAIAALKKAYEPLRGKKISPENSKRLNDIVKKFDNNKDMLMKIAKADVPFVSDAAITRLITKHNMKGADIKAAMKEEAFDEGRNYDYKEDRTGGVEIKNLRKRKSVYLQPGDEANDFLRQIEKAKNDRDEDMIMSDYDDVMEGVKEEKDDDGEEKTAAQKSDPDGDGKADGNGKKKPVKKKKKKEEGDDEKDNAEIGSNKPDVIDTKPSIETSSMVSEAEGSVKVKAGPAHDKKIKSITDLAKKMGLKVTRKGKSDDGKMTTIHLSGNQKKILDMQALQSRLDEDKQELSKISKELAGASKMHKGQSDRIKAMLKKKEDVKEMNHDDNEKDTNLIMQLRKAVSLRGHTVTFKSGKEKVSQPEAQAFLKAYGQLKKPAEKEFMMNYAMKSKSDMKSATMGKYKKPGKGGLDLPKMKSEK